MSHINYNFSDRSVWEVLTLSFDFDAEICVLSDGSLLPRWSISQRCCFNLEHISWTKSTQSGVSFLKQRPKIPPVCCLFYEHWEGGKRGWEGWKTDSRRGSWCKKKKNSKVTVCLDFNLNDLRYHFHPDAELSLNSLTLGGLHFELAVAKSHNSC